MHQNLGLMPLGIGSTRFDSAWRTMITGHVHKRGEDLVGVYHAQFFFLFQFTLRLTPFFVKNMQIKR